MKTVEIAQKYEIDCDEFERYLIENQLQFKQKLFGVNVVDDNLVEAYVSSFKKWQAEIEKAEAPKRKAMAEMLITSGFSFEGYRIVKYSGYISGDDAISVNRGFDSYCTSGTDLKEALMSSLVKIRRNALKELKEAAYDLGCNAVIGVDFDYLTLAPEIENSDGGTTYEPYVFGVTANGNAVVIEKIED